MMLRTRRQLRLLLVLAVAGVLAAAASYATIQETSSSVAPTEAAVWAKVVAVTTADLSKAAAEGVRHAALAAITGSANPATSAAPYLAKGTQRTSGCPLCRAGIKICPRRSGA